MLQNYLKIACRNVLRYQGYSFINVAGLAVGMACCLLILLYVRDELSYDRFHEKANRTYRVTSVFTADQEIVVTPTIVAPTFKREFPEVEETVRLYDVGSFRPVVVRYGDRMFQEAGFMYADSTVFDVFTLPLVAGDPASALTRPNTLVLTESAARKYFAGADPLGEMLTVGSDQEFEVTGVMADVPSNSHLHFDFLASFSSTHWAEEEMWWSANFLTYVVLRDANDVSLFAEHIDQLLARVKRQQPDLLSNEYTLRLQPLTGIHLNEQGRMTYVYLFSAIAAFILLIACINYLNLATARAARRAKEVGVRKVLGANRGQLTRQFYAESALLTVAALVLALALALAMLPALNAMSGKDLAIEALHLPSILAGFLLIGLIVTVLAGSYPALVLSSFQPVSVLKGSSRTGAGKQAFRRGLVAFQFAVSIFLIAATAVVYNQLQYVRSQHLGFDKEQVVVLPIGDRQITDQITSLKDELLQHPNVLHASAVNSIPGYQRGGYSLIAEGFQVPEGEYSPIRGVPADKDVVETLGLELVAGPGFPKSEAYRPEAGTYAYIINEATARAVGWTPEQAIGKKMGVSGGRMGEVVGVVRDYHYASLHETVEPLALFIEPEYEYLMVKIAPNDLAGTLGFLQRVWTERAPHRPFNFTFLDQEYDALYRSEERTGQIFGTFAVLAVLIGCLGLFGLAALTAEQRSKEIGVRKVLGATVPDVVALLSREFVMLVLAGLVIAVPAAYFIMSRWLEAFAYRTEITWWIFALSGATALAIALLTVSYQSVKAALADPVKALRYE